MEDIKKVALGVDIGGSHITAAAVDLTTFKIIRETYSHCTIDKNAERNAILAIWANVIKKALKSAGGNISGIGIAMPGPFDYPNGKAMFKGNDKYEALHDINIRKELSQLLDIDGKKINFFNDAASFVVGAAFEHEIADKRVLGITLGTGFGASFLQNNLPAIEGGGIPENGCLWDKPFKEGIADDYFSTRWFIGENFTLTGESYSGVKELIESNAENATKIFNEFTANLSGFLGPFLEAFKADVLLIGGNISRSHPFFLDGLRSALTEKRQIQIGIVDDTEVCNMLGASYLMTVNYWEKQARLTTFF